MHPGFSHHCTSPQEWTGLRFWLTFRNSRSTPSAPAWPSPRTDEGTEPIATPPGATIFDRPAPPFSTAVNTHADQGQDFHRKGLVGAARLPADQGIVMTPVLRMRCRASGAGDSRGVRGNHAVRTNFPASSARSPSHRYAHRNPPDRKSTRLNSSHTSVSRMPSSA